jgi:hypothetical protein
VLRGAAARGTSATIQPDFREQVPHAVQLQLDGSAGADDPEFGDNNTNMSVDIQHVHNKCNEIQKI